MESHEVGICFGILMVAWACACSMDNLRELGKGDMYVWRMYLNATAGNDRFRSGYLLKVSGPKKTHKPKLAQECLFLSRGALIGLQGVMGIGG